MTLYFTVSLYSHFFINKTSIPKSLDFNESILEGNKEFVEFVKNHVSLKTSVNCNIILKTYHIKF